MYRDLENMEWEQEAPQLASQSRNTPYQVPTSYFDDLHKQVMSQIKIKEFEKESSGFTHPDHYFEQLNARILAQTTATNRPRKTFKLWQSDIVKYAAAACFVILSAAGLYWQNQTQVSKIADSAHQLNAQLRLQEMQDDALLYAIDENLIIEHMMENETVNNIEVPSMATSEAIEDYLVDNYSTKDLTMNY